MIRGFEKISFPQYKSDNLDIEYLKKGGNLNTFLIK